MSFSYLYWHWPCYFCKVRKANHPSFYGILENFDLNNRNSFMVEIRLLSNRLILISHNHPEQKWTWKWANRVSLTRSATRKPQTPLKRETMASLPDTEPGWSDLTHPLVFWYSVIFYLSYNKKSRSLEAEIGGSRLCVVRRNNETQCTGSVERLDTCRKEP